MSLRPRLLAAAHPGFVTVGVLVAGGKVSFGAIKDVTDSVVAAEQAALTDLGFVVADPMPDLKFHQLALAIRAVKLKCTVEGVGSLLVIVKHEVPAESGNAVGEPDTQPPTRHIHLMNALIA